MSDLSYEEHKARHIFLHENLDELFADFIQHHPQQHGFLERPIRELLEWSCEQKNNPTEPPR
jgi:hypothetical protein